MEENITGEEIVNRIKAILDEKGMTMTELADKAGFSRQGYYNWSVRGAIMPCNILYNIAQVLDVTMEYIMTGNDSVEMMYKKLDTHTKEAVRNFIERLSK